MSNVVRLDNMMGTTVGTHLFSGKYATFASNKYTPVDMDNGMVGKLGGLITGERELHWVTEVEDTTPLDEIVLLASPEFVTDERKKNLSDFTNAADEVGRFYKLHKGDIFGVTLGCFSNLATDKPVVGDVVELADGYQWYAVTSLTSGSTRVGTVIAIDTVGTTTFYVIQVG